MTHAQKSAKQAIKRIQLLLWSDNPSKTIGSPQEANTAIAWAVRSSCDGSQKLARLRAYAYSEASVRFTDKGCPDPTTKFWPFQIPVGEKFEVSVTLEETRDNSLLRAIIALAENASSETLMHPAFDGPLHSYIWSREGKRLQNELEEHRRG